MIQIINVNPKKVNCHLSGRYYSLARAKQFYHTVNLNYSSRAGWINNSGFVIVLVLDHVINESEAITSTIKITIY